MKNINLKQSHIGSRMDSPKCNFKIIKSSELFDISHFLQLFIIIISPFYLES